MNNKKLEKLLTTSEFADRFNVTERFLQNDRSTKRLIPYIKIGRLVRYRESDGIEFIENNKIGGMAA